MQDVAKRRPSLQDFEIWKEKESADKAKQVREQKVDWDRYVEANQISADQAGLLKDYDDSNQEDQDDLLAEQGTEYATTFVTALQEIASEDTVNYLLLIVDDLLARNADYTNFFHSITDSDINPYSPFMRILTRNSVSQFAVNRASQILARLFSTMGEDALESTDVSEFVDWVARQLTTSGSLLEVVKALKTLLRSQHIQKVFVNEAGLKGLSDHLRKETQNTQLLYYVTFCFWLISYNKEINESLIEFEVIVRLVNVLKATPRKKVVRIAFAMFNNLLSTPAFAENMIGSGLLLILPNLSARKWQDDELEKDIKHVEETLQQHMVTLSSYEKYHAELLSGHLTWTPVHSERFWRQHYNKFADDNFQNVRILASLLDKEDDYLTLEVASYDLGEFARFHPDGRRVITKINAKKRLMQLMSHPVAPVAKQALITVQKLMVNNWESLNSTVKR